MYLLFYKRNINFFNQLQMSSDYLDIKDIDLIQIKVYYFIQ